MKYDLHIHSKYSYDSLMSPEKIIKAAKKKGLDGIAITDHNTIKGGLEALKVNKDKQFHVIAGAEIKTNFGDIIGLFINEEITSRRFQDVVDEIRSQGGLSILAHPYRQYGYPELLVKEVDLVEGFNARSKGLSNRLSMDLATKFKKSLTAGSDAHITFYIGYGVTITCCEIEDALRKGSTMIQGIESNYYLAHGSSFISEKLKAFLWQKMLCMF